MSMKKISLNQGWTFWKKGKEDQAENVNLPHDAMIHRERVRKLKNGSYTGFYPSGDYVYRKVIFGEESLSDQTIILEFEGVYMYSTVFLNGEKIGGHIYGYSNYYVELTGKLKLREENELLVEVHCSQVPNARWYPGNGIYRPVWMHIGKRQHIHPDAVQIITESTSPAWIRVRVDLDEGTCGDCHVATQIYRGESVIAEETGRNCRMEIPDAKLWDEKHPNLYRAVTVLYDSNGKETDRQENLFGIRSLSWSAEKGLLINGKKTLLRGGCVHHDYGILAACDFEAASIRKVRILKEAGFNAIRSSHYPISKSMLKACDELGMYIMDEAFDNWREPTGQYGYSLEFETEWRNDLAGMVQKDRNHPSVIMYSIGNEISDTSKPEGAVLAREMRDLCRKLDETRPVLVCPNLFMNTLSKMGFSFSLGDGQKLQRTDVTDPLLEAPDSQMGGSVAINFLVMTGPALMNMLLTPGRSEKGVRDVYQMVDIAGYNYGTKVYEGHHKLNPTRIMVGSETYPADIAKTWKLIRKSPFILGDFMWTAWDYMGEVGVGFVEYGKSSGAYIKPYPAVSAYTGVIDLIGHREPYSHLAAVAWGMEKKPYIAVQPLNHAGEKKHFSHYRKTDAVESWSWPGYEGKKTIVEVYSRGTYVELLQNGKSLGKKKLKDREAKFEVKYYPGMLEAVSYDPSHCEIARSVLSGADSEKVLSVKSDREVLRADGEDLAFIDISLTDKNGIVHILEESKITVTVEGAGELAGFGTGNPKPEEPYDGNIATAYQGRALAVIRSGYQTGSVTVHISAEGYGSREITLNVE